MGIPWNPKQFVHQAVKNRAIHGVASVPYNTFSQDQAVTCGVVTIDNTAIWKSNLLQFLYKVFISKKLTRIDFLELPNFFKTNLQLHSCNEAYLNFVRCSRWQIDS